jgi:hypothetical protein
MSQHFFAISKKFFFAPVVMNHRRFVRSGAPRNVLFVSVPGIFALSRRRARAT